LEKLRTAEGLHSRVDTLSIVHAQLSQRHFLAVEADLLPPPVLRKRTHEGEDDGEDDEAVVEAEHADEEEDLEEGEEDVGVGGGEEDEGEDGGEAAVEDGRAHPPHRLNHPRVPDYREKKLSLPAVQCTQSKCEMRQLIRNGLNKKFPKL
jgi:hypothetical protein